MRTPAPDKVLHFAAGTLAAAAGAAAAALHQQLGHGIPPAAGAALACLALALLREFYNTRTGGRWSWGDVAATLLGGLSVVGVALLV